MGTSSCLVYSTGKGLVLKEPTVVVYDKDTEKIKAIAQATFKNNVETQDSEPKQWSFKDAWTEPEGLNGLTPEQKTILDNFLNALGITNP